MAKVHGLQVDIVTPQEIKERYPLINVDDILGGTFIPSDGQANPSNAALSLAKGARQRGAQIFEDTLVTGFLTEGRRITGVKTAQGHIQADQVVLAPGMWGRDLAAGLNSIGIQAAGGLGRVVAARGSTGAP